MGSGLGAQGVMHMLGAIGVTWWLESSVTMSMAMAVVPIVVPPWLVDLDHAPENAAELAGARHHAPAVELDVLELEAHERAGAGQERLLAGGQRQPPKLGLDGAGA